MQDKSPTRMDSASFDTLWVEAAGAEKFQRRIIRRHVGDLPPGEVLVRVRYSSLNYKDALSASGNPGVTRHYPHTPGIDAAGEVALSASLDFKPGEPVVVMGFDLGMNTPGGFGQYVRVPAAWVRKLPEGLTLWESMAIGTAGFTAAICAYRLEEYGLRPGSGELLVTGASGGVGSFAVSILARDGYSVAAATGKREQYAWLERLGGKPIDREEIDDRSGRPLLSGRWAGGVDTVGGNYLATLLRATRPGGCVACCGNAASPELHLTVFPFILRGVALLGVDMATTSPEQSAELWRRLGDRWKPQHLDEMARTVPLAGLDAEIERILRGGQAGRVVVSLEN